MSSSLEFPITRNGKATLRDACLYAVCEIIEPLLEARNSFDLSLEAEKFYWASVESNFDPDLLKELHRLGIDMTSVVKGYATEKLLIPYETYQEFPDTICSPDVPDPNNFKTYDLSLQTQWTSPKLAKEIFSDLKNLGNRWTGDSIDGIIAFTEKSQMYPKSISPRKLCDSFGAAANILAEYPLIKTFADPNHRNQLIISAERMFGLGAWFCSTTTPAEYKTKVPKIHLN